MIYQAIPYVTKVYESRDLKLLLYFSRFINLFLKILASSMVGSLPCVFFKLL